MGRGFWVQNENLALLTDLYELTRLRVLDRAAAPYDVEVSGELQRRTRAAHRPVQQGSG